MGLRDTPTPLNGRRLIVGGTRYTREPDRDACAHRFRLTRTSGIAERPAVRGQTICTDVMTQSGVLAAGRLKARRVAESERKKGGKNYVPQNAARGVWRLRAARVSPPPPPGCHLGSLQLAPPPLNKSESDGSAFCAGGPAGGAPVGGRWVSSAGLYGGEKIFFCERRGNDAFGGAEEEPPIEGIWGGTLFLGWGVGHWMP